RRFLRGRGLDLGEDEIVNAVNVDTGSKQIGGTPERERRQVSTVGQPPNANAVAIDIGPALQVPSGRKDIVELDSPSGGCLFRKLECLAVADPEAEVYRQYHESPVREVLVHGIRMGVVVAVMP